MEPKVSDLIHELTPHLEATFSRYSGRPGRETARALLSWKRARSYFRDMTRVLGDLRGKRLLEVGCGYGLILTLCRKAGIRAEGIEPAIQPQYQTTHTIAKTILDRAGYSPSLIKSGKGEMLPYKDNSFDVVTSFLTLEHVDDVAKTIKEMVRVTRPGGFLYSVVPNYGSFWEPHYGIPWIPYVPKILAKIWVRLLGKNPGLVNELQLITPRLLIQILKNQPVSIVSLGEKLFAEKIILLEYSDLDATGIAKQILYTYKRLHLLPIISIIVRLLGAQTPIVLLARKQQ